MIQGDLQRRKRPVRRRSVEVRGAKSRRSSYRPRVELLEGRRLLAGDTLLVTTENDDAGEDPTTLSLREAIQVANIRDGLDRIRFARSVRDITLTKGELLITDDLKIEGRGSHRLTISGDNSTRVFNIGVMAADTADVSISKLTIADGLADVNTTPNSSTGGAILVNEGSSLVLKDAVLKDNKAVGDKDTVIAPTPIFTAIGGAVGGGIANFGTLDRYRLSGPMRGC